MSTVKHPSTQRQGGMGVSKGRGWGSLGCLGVCCSCGCDSALCAVPLMGDSAPFLSVSSFLASFHPPCSLSGPL